MSSEKKPADGSTAPRDPDAASDARRYEAPRILSKRSVERITLLSSPTGPIGPGSGIGGQ
jgi:hypothetical protein